MYQTVTNTLTILVGIPASGKSTYAKEYVKNNPNCVRVCRDDFRYHLTPNWKFNKDNEAVITYLELNAVLGMLSNGYDVILDATNLKQDVVAKWESHIEFALEHPVWVVTKVFDTPFEECVKRNALRDGYEMVPYEVMERMQDNFDKLKL